MRNIRSTDTKMEIQIRSELYRKGFRFRKNKKFLVGKPDIVFPKYKTVVFLDSCFWHMCPYHCIIPKTNELYWKLKLLRNRNRAKEVNTTLKREGWKVIRIWEHQIKQNKELVLEKIIRKLK